MRHEHTLIPSTADDDDENDVLDVNPDKKTSEAMDDDSDDGDERM
jgi:hypothetical protein